MKIISEFKEFAIKGSMIDMATGIIIGAAFGTVIKSLVDDILMPPLGVLTGGLDFSRKFVVIRDGAAAGPYVSPEAAAEAGATTLNYGIFINNIISFLIVAVAVFFLIKLVNRFKREEEQKKEDEAPGLSKSEELLSEIRDALVK